jgi:pimeloyl-ACP methyl ester carboxylesterase
MNESLKYLARPDGRISYTVRGPADGPLVVAVPGMGDLRGTWREVTGPLVESGYRVAVTDLRGHGDSDATFRTYGDDATAGDILALIDELGGPALVLGNSMSGSAAIIAASERPDAVAGLALVSPFGREAQSPGAARAMRVLYRVLFARPWGAAVWASYYAGPLNKGAKATWLPEHVAAIRASMRNPGHLRALRHLVLQLDHSVVEPHLARVAAPTLILIGALDPDYKNPASELAWLGEQLHAETELVENAGHYAQTQRADVVVPRIHSFADALREGAAWKTTSGSRGRVA